jgi:hypothetical protein
LFVVDDVIPACFPQASEAEDMFNLSGFFFCLQSEFLFVFDLFLFYLLVEVAPVAAGDDELVDLELRMNAHCPVKEIGVERIGCGKPDAG